MLTRSKRTEPAAACAWPSRAAVVVSPGGATGRKPRRSNALVRIMAISSRLRLEPRQAVQPVVVGVGRAELFADRGRILVDLHEACHARVRRIVFARDEANREIAVVNAGVQQAGTGNLRLAGIDEVRRIALRQVDIVQCAHQLRPFHLDQPEFLRIGDDVVDAAFRADTIAQLDQPCLLQQQQAAALVDRVARHADARAFLQFVEALQAARVQADVGQHPERYAAKPVAALLDGIVEERLMLEVIDVEIARRQGDIGRGPVREFHDLDVEALLACFGCSHFDGVGECARCDPDAQRGGMDGGQQYQRSEQGGKRSRKEAGDLHDGPVGMQGNNGIDR
ncbi:protein of unknown function (plasmid) [Cupriavidus taiwanensis]|uniref:Uncharacterized protein n=1 Tax=Cupriavidus taiwanensis TaxID=164546 RepID=A0A375IVF6_9BURK|nr:protein of unknown function [Cupriavidus taiwanensis]